MTLSYVIGDSLYLNITNRCDLNCTFCVRQGQDGLSGSGSLWLEHEPDAGEMAAELSKRDLSSYREIVFCGYGEPTRSLDVLLATAKWIKERAPEVILRLDTNGLADKNYKKETAPLLSGLIDSISISLNAPNAERYAELTGAEPEAYGAMLKFAESCKGIIPKIQFTVVDVLTPREIDRCREIAAAMEIPLRVRHFID